MPSSRTVLCISALAGLVSSGAAFAPAPSSLPLRSAQRSSACTQINMGGGHHEETVRLTRGECQCIDAYVLHLERELGIGEEEVESTFPGIPDGAESTFAGILQQIQSVSL